MSELRCERFENAHMFSRRIRDWMTERPVDNNMLATMVTSRIEKFSLPEHDDLWVAVVDDDTVVGAAGMPSPYPLIIPRLSPAAIDALVTELIKARPRLEGASGPQASCERFVSLWTAHTGATERAVAYQSMYELTATKKPSGIPGEARLATGEDIDLVTDYVTRYQRETNASGPATPQDLRRTSQRQIEAGVRVWIWELEGDPICLLTETFPENEVLRIKHVYTDSNYRGQGYAAALVSTVSTIAIQRDDVEHCVLYSDQDDQKSTNIYLRIGYQKVHDTVTYEFTYPVF